MQSSEFELSSMTSNVGHDGDDGGDDYEDKNIIHRIK